MSGWTTTDVTVPAIRRTGRGGSVVCKGSEQGEREGNQVEWGGGRGGGDGSDVSGRDGK